MGLMMGLSYVSSHVNACTMCVYTSKYENDLDEISDWLSIILVENLFIIAFLTRIQATSLNYHRYFEGNT